MTTNHAKVRAVAAAIANARGMRRGVPTITNILELIPKHLVDEVTEDAEAAIEALKVIPCSGCSQKGEQLKDAVELLRRGVNMLHRVGWEPGETDVEWQMAAALLVGLYDQDAEHMRANTRPKA
jgi:hypothetical protein